MEAATSTPSTLTGPALQASRAALNAALADQANNETTALTDDTADLGEGQVVDMQAQAEGIKTVFSDPTNFNVKVRCKTSDVTRQSALLSSLGTF